MIYIFPDQRVYLSEMIEDLLVFSSHVETIRWDEPWRMRSMGSKNLPTLVVTHIDDERLRRTQNITKHPFQM